MSTRVRQEGTIGICEAVGPDSPQESAGSVIDMKVVERKPANWLTTAVVYETTYYDSDAYAIMVEYEPH